MLFVSFIFKNLFRRKIRSALTVGGVAVAITAVVALLGIANGLEQSFAELYQKRGVDLMVVRAGSTERLGSSLPERVGDQIRQMAGVQTVTPGLMDVISFEDRSLISVPIQGWAPDSFLFDDLKFTSGRRLQAGDQRGVMLGMILARNLDKQAGEAVEMFGEDFRVVGVFESFNVYENGSAIVLLGDLQELMGRPNGVTGFQVVVQNSPDKEARVAQLRNQIEALRDQRGRTLGLAALPTEEYVKSTTQIRVAHANAWITSVIALIIGAIGVLNTMIMSVFERTKEIGILRAIGWRKGRVIRMILSEAMLLSAAGAVCGIVGAVALTRLLSSLPAASGYIEGKVAVDVMVKGFAIALLVGLAGGTYPALRGAQLLPNEAIRHE